ncbi:hypothetical protein GGI07_001314 [Coemansia sp. Benny D115]|nr:hypothetical protein GGI07_001314 [Coemansia sp. Benny D115]
MDYRDRDGYFQEDVLRVLGRSGSLSAASTMHSSLSTHPGNNDARMPGAVPTYGSLQEGNFVEEEDRMSETSASTTSSKTSIVAFDADAEWEEVKKVLYTTFVGMLLPVVCRYVGRRFTVSLWTRFLGLYFKSH